MLDKSSQGNNTLWSTSSTPGETLKRRECWRPSKEKSGHVHSSCIPTSTKPEISPRPTKNDTQKWTRMNDQRLQEQATTGTNLNARSCMIVYFHVCEVQRLAELACRDSRQKGSYYGLVQTERGVTEPSSVLEMLSIFFWRRLYAWIQREVIEPMFKICILHCI